jgi:hypothetical protein
MSLHYIVITGELSHQFLCNAKYIGHNFQALTRDCGYFTVSSG